MSRIFQSAGFKVLQSKEGGFLQAKSSIWYLKVKIFYYFMLTHNNLRQKIELFKQKHTFYCDLDTAGLQAIKAKQSWKEMLEMCDVTVR